MNSKDHLFGPDGADISLTMPNEEEMIDAQFPGEWEED